MCANKLQAREINYKLKKEKYLPNTYILTK